MYCHSCHAPNNQVNLFCTSCGMRLAPPSPDQALESRVRAGSAQDGAAGRQEGSPDADGWLREKDAGRPVPGEESSWPVQYQPSTQGGQGWGQSLVSASGGMPVLFAPPLPSRYPGEYLPISTVFCASCGRPRGSRLDTCPYCGRIVANTSGQGISVPAELASNWNWGAFMFPLLWSISHQTWFGLLALVPGMSLVMGFVLATRGNDLAWQNRRFRDMEHYQDVQRAWRNSAIGFAAIIAAIFVIVLFSGV